MIKKIALAIIGALWGAFSFYISILAGLSGGKPVAIEFILLLPVFISRPIQSYLLGFDLVPIAIIAPILAGILIVFIPSLLIKLFGKLNK